MIPGKYNPKKYILRTKYKPGSHDKAKAGNPSTIFHQDQPQTFLLARTSGLAIREVASAPCLQTRFFLRKLQRRRAQRVAHSSPTASLLGQQNVCAHRTVHVCRQRCEGLVQMALAHLCIGEWAHVGNVYWENKCKLFVSFNFSEACHWVSQFAS